MALLVPPRPGAAQVQPLSTPDTTATHAAVVHGRSQAAVDSQNQRQRRLRWLVGGSAVSYGVIYTGLTTAWYTGEQVPLHWFNDLPEWQQLDKAGHFWGSFQESRGAVDMLRWAGLSEKKAIWYGSFVG
ncbi:MAG: hypothetical protein JWR44_3688, partial [Hymenobacter sp.]|nr:hypothetical protein [Hymenobacter sp.]